MAPFRLPFELVRTDATGSSARMFQESRTDLNAASSGTARDLPHPDLADVQLPQVLFALSDPARLDLVRELAAHGQLSVAQCHAIGPDVPKSTFSHQLKTLREAGLIWSLPDGRR